MRRTGVVAALVAAVLALSAAPALAASPIAVLDAPARVSFGASVPLDGSRSSDPDGNAIVEYRWQIDSLAVQTTTTATFNHPAVGIGRHTAKLVVRDSTGALSTQVTKDFVVVDDTAPTAVLSVPSAVGIGKVVPLTGTSSTDPPPGDIIEWQWQIDSRAVVATDTGTFNHPAGSPPLALGRHTAKLRVIDDSGNLSAQVTQDFFVVDDVPPTAALDAPSSVSISNVLTLSGSRSADAGGGRVVEWRWTVGSRPVVATSDPTFSSPPGLPVGRTTVTLVVVDDSGNVSSPTQAQVVVRDDVAPSAVIDAPRSVALGDRIPLSGGRSTDVGGRVIRFTWRIDGGSEIQVSDAAFTTGVLGPGNHTVSLRVTDDSGNESSTVTATVFVGDDIAPTAVLDAPATVRVGASIPLSGAGSTDVRGRVVRYRWTIDGGSPIETADPAFTSAALPLGRHTLSLVVTDDAGNESTADTKAVIVVDDLAPIAVLDAPATVAAGAPIPLSGARSSDLGGRIVSFRWTVDDRPPVVTDAPAFSAPGVAAGTHTVSLVVTDDSGNQSAPDTRTVIVPAAPPPPPPTQPKPPAGTKLATLGSATLLAPAGKKAGLVDLKKGTLVAGRLFSPVATTVKAVFTTGKLKLGSATLKLAAGATKPLTAKLPAAARKALKGKKKLKVTVKAGKVTRTLTLDVK